MFEMSCGDGETRSASGIDLPPKQDETILFQITGVEERGFNASLVRTSPVSRKFHPAEYLP
jgi:hypothetical protein